jgi:hypothetical protein
MNDFQDKEAYHEIIKKWSQFTEKKISRFSIGSSQTTETLFRLLRDGKWKVKVIYFRACGVDNSIGAKLSILPSWNLLRIHFESEPIGNAGFKSIAKL